MHALLYRKTHLNHNESPKWMKVRPDLLLRLEMWIFSEDGNDQKKHHATHIYYESLSNIFRMLRGLIRENMSSLKDTPQSNFFLKRPLARLFHFILHINLHLMYICIKLIHLYSSVYNSSLKQTLTYLLMSFHVLH